MGEVYRARDTRLNRDVALKILPAEVSEDPSRRQRFEMEARAVAALNHPNIVAVYDIGAESGTSYIISELVDGEPLGVAKFGLRKTLDIASQIAAGLACAYEAGIVHRDLKPDNILLSRDGRPKIIDFGLAKAVRPTVAVSNDTLTMRTEPGVVMGTAAYMSPEQVRGVEADHRSDIFSFGLILYELLSGKRAFPRDTSVETMRAILKEDPPPMPEALPAPVREIVTHCLEKDPRDRFQCAKDLVFALSQAAAQSGGAAANQTFSSPRRLRLGLIMILIAGVAVLASHYFWNPPAADVWSALRLGGPEVAMTPRLSPDGHTLAFLAMVNRQTEVGIMKPDAGDWSLLTHHPERGSVTAVSWAPDGNKLYFDRVLDVPHGVFSIPVLGGEEQLVLEDAMSPETLPDGSLLIGRLNSAHELQLFHYWPESGRLEPLPLQISFSLFLSQVRAFPDGREAVVLGSPTGQILQAAKDLYLLDVNASIHDS
jgi:eukaryotic-like serine/threonine-protein kinase